MPMKEGNLSSIERLLWVMSQLRDPHHGCPWDLAQTPQSIVPYTLEEAYEVAEAVASDDVAELRTELGDLLFQIIFQAQCATEKGQFTFEDLVCSLTEKLLRRHPHVFSSVAAAGLDSREVEQQWDRIKQEERNLRSRHSLMDDIPLALPALARANKLQQRARRAGFDWEEARMALEKVHEEMHEVAETLRLGEEQCRLEEEIGDVLFAVVNWARLLGVDAESALRSTNRKFERRFRWMENTACNRDSRFADLALSEQELLWEEAKQSERDDR